jgi:hypothetical protein
MRLYGHIVFVLVIVGMGMEPASHAQSPAVTLTPSILPIQVDSSGSFRVHLGSMRGIHAYAIQLSYDTTIVRCRRVTHQPFLSGTTFFTAAIDSTHGTVTINEAILGPGAQDGSGDVAEVQFLAAKSGSSTVAITLADLRDTLNQFINVSVTGAQIFVGPLNSVHAGRTAEVTPIAIGCYPNPCNPSTTVRYTVREPGRTSIRVFALLGSEVCAEHRYIDTPGVAEWRWDGRNAQGKNVASGTYLVRVQTASGAGTLKVFLMR